jgi:hypothetical protein
MKPLERTTAGWSRRWMHKQHHPDCCPYNPSDRNLGIFPSRFHTRRCRSIRSCTRCVWLSCSCNFRGMLRAMLSHLLDLETNILERRVPEFPRIYPHVAIDILNRSPCRTGARVITLAGTVSRAEAARAGKFGISFARASDAKAQRCKQNISSIAILSETL